MNGQPSIRDQLSGFPIFQMALIGLLRLSEPIAFASFLSYIFFMIKSFRIAKNDADVSRFSGYLASAFSFSQFLSSVQWGHAADKYGRKPIILVGCLGTALSMLVFGFSPNFYVAFLARVMMGLLNGNVSIMRTIVGEIAVEKRHQGIAFSNLSLIWSLGKAIGYYLSGILTDVDHFRDYDNDKEQQQQIEKPGRREAQQMGIFARFPFAFSNIVVASMIFSFVILGWLFLEETHDVVKYKRDRGLEVGDKVRSLLGFEVPERPWQQVKDEAADHLISSTSSDKDDEEEEEYEMQSFSSDYTPTIVEEPVLTSPIIYRIACNFLLSFSNVIYAEFLPVFLAKTIDAKSLKFPFLIKGGFGFTTSEIGTLLSVTGVIAVVLVSLGFPVINKYLTVLTAFRMGLLFMPIAYFCLPLIIFTIPQYSHLSPKLTNSLLFTEATAIGFIQSLLFSQVTLLVHRVSPKKHRGLVNGYTISITALARFISPLIWGYVMTGLDVKNVGGLSWWLLGTACFFAFCVTLMMNEDDDLE
ncbi:uncharacterized protein LODBEIA_P37870 [Lodderomyces beijingensis]|uniref:Major facilitator superfamily (MFS) profile domain-containing protein n=1 Tax=Lodderomyces beijingensis TaxID=1775926 RepID=A0ABP0ZN63_9ASCO